MNRMHPQDLRAIMAAVLSTDNVSYNGSEWLEKVVDHTDRLLVELDRTAKPELVTDFKADNEAEWEEAYYQKLHLDAMERAVKNTREVLGAKNHEATEVAAKRVMAEMDRLKSELKTALEPK